MRGMLVAIEGPDGVGKSTLASQLQNRLLEDGFPCDLMAFPGNDTGSLGELIYKIHHDPGAFGLADMTESSRQVLHIAAHINAIECRIIPSLAEGRWVLLDRYWWSTWVYGLVSGIQTELLRAMLRIEALSWGDIRPDLIILLERDHPFGRCEDHVRFQRLATEYHALAERETHVGNVRVLRNADAPEQVLEQVIDELEIGQMDRPE